MEFIDHSPEITELAKALLAVQKTMLPANKDATNPFTRSKYASLNSVMDTCRSALLDNGIWLCQYPVPIDAPNSLGLMTKLTHAESGQWQSSLAVVPLPKADPQGMGSAITYARRYALTSMLGMVTEDDDGEAARAGKPREQTRQTQQRQASPREQPKQNASQADDLLADLPQLDGVIYQLVTDEQNKEYIIATGKTQPKKDILSGMGFRWHAQRKYWWKMAEAA